MRRILDLVLALSAFTSVCAIALFAVTESRLPVFQYADTYFSPSLSLDKVPLVAVGDSMETVQTLLGSPIWKLGCGGCWEPRLLDCRTEGGVEGCTEDRTPGTCSAPCDAATQTWRYTEDGACPFWDFAWREIAVHFEHGVVADVTDQWRYD